MQCINRPSDRVRGCRTAQFGLTRTITHNRQNPAQYWKISWKFKLNQVFLLISKISRKLLGYLPSKTNEKSIAFSSNSSGAYENNKALSIARAVMGTSHVHIEYCVELCRHAALRGILGFFLSFSLAFSFVFGVPTLQKASKCPTKIASTVLTQVFWQFEVKFYNLQTQHSRSCVTCSMRILWLLLLNWFDFGLGGALAAL